MDLFDLIRVLLEIEITVGLFSSIPLSYNEALIGAMNIECLRHTREYWS